MLNISCNTNPFSKAFIVMLAVLLLGLSADRAVSPNDNVLVHPTLQKSGLIHHTTPSVVWTKFFKSSGVFEPYAATEGLLHVSASDCRMPISLFATEMWQPPRI